MPSKVLAAWLLALLPLPALADYWISAASDATAIYYVNTDSVRSGDGGRITFQSVRINKDENYVSPEGTPVRYEVRTMAANCLERTLNTERSVAYDINDIPYNMAAVSQPARVEPGSTEDRVLARACEAMK